MQVLQLQQSRPFGGPMLGPKESLNQLSYQWTRRNDKLTSGPYPRQNTQQHPHDVRLTPRPLERWIHTEVWRGVAGFLRCLIRSALIRWYWDQDVFISNQKSMMLCIFIQSRLKRAEAVTLLDSGAIENFISIDYTKKLGLPIWRLTYEQRLFNVDRTPNKAGSLKYYTNISTRTGSKRTCLQYFLMDLGENQVILGYPWFASTQPRINWAKG